LFARGRFFINFWIYGAIKRFQIGKFSSGSIILYLLVLILQIQKSQIPNNIQIER
jgi:hypothetical protein